MQDAIPQGPLAFIYRPPTVLGFVLALVALKCVVALNTDLVGDEAYYTLWSLYPLQTGYYDHPPAVVWFIKIGQGIFGENAFASRFMAIISTAICSLAIWRTSSNLFDDIRISAISVYWFNVTIGATLGLFVITPDAPSILFWMLAIWSASELLRSGSAKWWIAFGLFAGLGLQAKYSTLFLGAGILLWLISFKKNWQWFSSPWLYLGGALALLIFSPVIFWNLSNDLSSLKFQLGRSAGILDSGFPTLKYLLELIFGQIGMMLPWLFVLAFFGFWVFITRKSLRSNRAVGLLVLTAIPLIAYFLIHATHSRVQGNWPWLIYPQLAILAAWMSISWQSRTNIGSWLQRQSRYWQIGTGSVIAVFVFVQAAWVPFTMPRALTYAQLNDTFGWQEIAKAVESIAVDRDIDTIVVVGYPLMGWLASYGKFENLDYDVIPFNQTFRYGFMDLERYENASTPRLVAVQAARSSLEGRAKWPKQLQSNISFVHRINRLRPNGEPQDSIDLYEYK